MSTTPLRRCQCVPSARFRNRTLTVTRSEVMRGREPLPPGGVVEPRLVGERLPPRGLRGR
jgi:hypothetical protein